MKTYSIVNLDTVEYSLLGHPKCFELPNTTRVNVISSDGEILDISQNRKPIVGRFGAHKLQIRALHQGRELSVEGSPYAFLYGQNLYTSNDLLAVLRELIPDMGRPFLVRDALSVESANGLERLRAKLLQHTTDPNALREYILHDYLVLYAQIGESIFLLAIRHHRQLAFDFVGQWGRGESL